VALHTSVHQDSPVSTSDLCFQPITELGRRLRTGGLSPVTLTEAFLARLTDLDGTLGAFQLVTTSRALDAARAAEAQLAAGTDLGPLHGIPYAVKDLFDVDGLPTTAGTHLLARNVARHDAAVVARLARAGMVLLGKTKTVQLAYGGAGINHDLGTPHNPWHRVPHLPGGSSSGSAVCVAAGLAPAALGTDTGGSVRIPAALCGITGLKTTVGQVSRAGVYPLSFSLDSVGPLARSVEDAALLYQAIQGPDAGDDTTRGRPRQDVMTRLREGVEGLRLGVADTVFWDEAHPAVETAVRGAARVFDSLGARVRSVEFPVAADALALNRRGLVIAAEAYAVNRRLVDEHYDELDPIVASRMVHGRDVAAADYLQTTLEWKRLRSEALRQLSDVDALLCPTTPTPACPVAEADRDMETYVRRNLLYLRNTAVGNILDLCGLSVPCGFTEDGLPVGLMIYGRPFHEDTVLRIGHAYQQATTWHLQRPDLAWIAP
jgi:aspartyl-tRNA(Asn)/glutamyl-tRNA(Gln) amidotransferase subunit A